jgi:hypothetical protein
MSAKRNEILGLIVILGAATCFALWSVQSEDPSSDKKSSGPSDKKPLKTEGQKPKNKTPVKAVDIVPGETPGTNKKPADPATNKVDSLSSKSPWADSRGQVHTKNGAIVVGLDYLTKNASRIVAGLVTDVQTRLGPERRLIFSYFTVAVRKTLKGSVTTETVTVRVLGGEVPGMPRLDASHQPHLEPGDEGVFFIDDDASLWTSLVGSSQGFLRIKRPGPTQTALEDGFGAPIFALNGDQRFVASPTPEKTSRMSEDELFAKVAEQLK